MASPAAVTPLGLLHMRLLHDRVPRWAWAPAAVAYQLPRVTGSMAYSAPLQNTATREACTGPYGQHCDRCVHQPPRWSTLPLHVACHLLLWSQKHLMSLRTVHVPG